MSFFSVFKSSLYQFKFSLYQFKLLLLHSYGDSNIKIVSKKTNNVSIKKGKKTHP